MKEKLTTEEKLRYERALMEKGYAFVAGVDEVGRGPLAGPVVCAAVIMPMEKENLIEGVDDSKKLSAKKREMLSALIKEKALAYCIVEVDEKTIDEINILEATKLGMKKALLGLQIEPSAVLTDGNMTLDIPFPQKSIVHGDALSYSIGAASIIAKVHRDALMDEYAKLYPEYAFEKNKGYGTAVHIKAIKEVGLCPVHRRTFTKNF
ncbi:MAG: ribonuclease HII [Clostridia bacterium]|nr:ribonuclease HII [Clostridia bacterium]